MNFYQINTLAEACSVTEHHLSTNARPVLLAKDPCFRILYFKEADCMLNLEALLLSLEPCSLVVVAPNASASVKFGTSCHYWQVAFEPGEAFPLLGQMFGRYFPLVHLAEPQGTVFCEEFQHLRERYLLKNEAGAADDLCFALTFGALLYDLADCFAREADCHAKEQNPCVAKRVASYLEEHYTEPLTLEALENIFFVRRYHICRQFHRVFGMTVMDYVRKLRISHASELLLTTNLSIEEIEKLCGFRTLQNFYAVFSALMGLTPLQYRKSAASGNH